MGDTSITSQWMPELTSPSPTETNQSKGSGRKSPNSRNCLNSNPSNQKQRFRLLGACKNITPWHFWRSSCDHCEKIAIKLNVLQVLAVFWYMFCHFLAIFLQPSCTFLGIISTGIAIVYTIMVLKLKKKHLKIATSYLQ